MESFDGSEIVHWDHELIRDEATCLESSTFRSTLASPRERGTPATEDGRLQAVRTCLRRAFGRQAG
jgi:hypothetical protein